MVISPEPSTESSEPSTETSEPSTEPTQPSTEQPSTEEPSEEPSEEPLTKEYYLVGTFNEWQINDAYKLTRNEEAEYILQNVWLTKDDTFKIVSSDNEWYPDAAGMDSEFGDIPEDGYYDVYFRPDCSGGEDWFCGCILVISPEPSTESSEPSTESSEPSTESSAETGGYYLVGTFNEWQIDDAYKLTRNGEAEYILRNVELMTDDELKICYSPDGYSTWNNSTWYPEGSDNNYSITKDGAYDIYFRPNYDGGDDWFHGCILVNSVEPATESSEPSTEEPSEELSEEPSEQPAETGGYYMIAAFNNYEVDDEFKLTKVEAEEDEVYTLRTWLTTTMTFTIGFSSDGENYETEYPDDGDYKYGQNGEIPKNGKYDIYFRPNYDGGEDWFYDCILVVPVEPPTEPTFDGYDLVLDGALGLRYYMELPEGFDGTDATMTFSMPHRKNQVIPYSAAESYVEDYRIFTCNVYAYQMADTITATFTYKKDGVTQTVTDTYSVKDYLKRINDGDYFEEVLDLVNATRAYGHFIQPYLARLNGWTVGDKYAELDYSGTVDVDAARNGSEAHKFTLTTMDSAYVQAAQYRLLMNADTSFIVEVRLNESPTDSVTMTIDGNAVTPTVSDTAYRVEVPNIAANNLEVRHRVVMQVGGTTVFDFTASPLSYVYTVLSKSNPTEDELNALASLYEYWMAADPYGE